MFCTQTDAPTSGDKWVKLKVFIFVFISFCFCGTILSKAEKSLKVTI